MIVDTVRRLPGPEEGRLLLNRLVAEGVRYGRDFAVVRVVAPEDVTDLIAPRLAEVLRDADILVRWSDTELLALLPATDRAGAARTSERLRDAAEGAAAVAVSSRLESELAELEPEEADAMRAELGVGEPGLDRVVRGAFALLDQLAFFTAGEDKPAQSWHLRRGLSAWHAAGMIHSDIQRGFVRAEVIAWDRLVEAGGYTAARERGELRIEGRDYTMSDGDVITVKFTP